MAVLAVRLFSPKVSLSQLCIYRLYHKYGYHPRARRGGYLRILPVPVYEAMKDNYREKVMKPIEEMATVEERIQELNKNNKEADVDISLPSKHCKKEVSIEDQLKLKKEMKADKEFEMLARNNMLKVDLKEVYREWQPTVGPSHIQIMAEHYGIYKHLFQHAYFTPWVPLNVLYEADGEMWNPVYMGNIIASSEVEKTPVVSFESKPDELWTLILTNLDGNLLDTESEYLHWFIGNIKGGDLSTGETLCPYLQPFPWKGTGYHRLAFVLYKQETAIDFSSHQRPFPCHCLKERTFRTFDFYKAHQDDLTPAGLAFFQCTWDTNLTDFIHNVLKMREPVFEYKEPEIYVAEQVHFPEMQPFNTYLDQYRDPKEIKKEVLLKRLLTLNPFEEEPPMPKYPVLHKPDNYLYSWQKSDMENERLRLGKYRDLRPHSVYPQEDSQGKYKYPS